MNRIIKFRAWSGDKMLMSSNFGTQCFFDFWNMLLDKPLMQFTGLFDKNGKEIYEGDILKIFNKNYEVKFNISVSGMKVDYGYPVIHNGPAPHWVEVIGNIYENKDLLK